MSAFKPASTYTQRHGTFVVVTGGTNSGKSWSALRLAKGLAGGRKTAAADTEGGRLLHLRKHFDFDLTMIEPPHRPEKYADVAKQAEDDGYGALVIDSFSMEWVGMGGVLDWQQDEYERLGNREAMKLMSWARPKSAHKAMVYSLLQRRIPIVFALRAEEKAKKVGSDVKTEWAPICNKAFPFEVTVSFMLMQNKQGIIDLSHPHKMEGSHREIFRDGEQLCERHGELLSKWAEGLPLTTTAGPVTGNRDVDSGWSPDGGWPTFTGDTAAVDFEKWSTKFLADAPPDHARAWETRYRKTLAALAGSKNATHRSITAELTALFNERITERAPADPADMFPGDMPGKAA
jgi:hypothetical protein